MPNLRTDDGPRKLRAIWLGPKGATLPFEWTYVQWSVVIAALVLTPFILGPIVWLLTGDVAWAVVLGVVWGGPGGAYLAVRIMKHVTFDEPLRFKRQMASDVVRAHYGRPQGRQIDRCAMPSIQYLATPTLRSLGWSDPAHYHPIKED